MIWGFIILSPLIFFAGYKCGEWQIKILTAKDEEDGLPIERKEEDEPRV